MKSLAELADLSLGPALAAQGFAGREVVARWAEIVGERLAARCRPQRIEWPKRRPGPEEEPAGAALVLRVESAFALELQQLAPVVLQRINAHLGWRAVDRLVLKQGPVESPEAEARPEATPAGDSAELRAAVARVGDPALREALSRLGSAVLGKEPG